MSIKVKPAAAVLDWPISWTLATSETISTATTTVAPIGASLSGDMTVGSTTINGAVTSALFSGGNDGKRYRATTNIVTNQGRTDSRSILFRIGTAEAV